MINKKKNGISLVALVCTIAITLMLVVTVSVSFNNIYTSTKRKEFANEIYSIQKLVDQYYFRNNTYPTVGSDVVIDLYALESGADQFSAETRNYNKSVTLKKLDLYEIGAQETNRGQQSDNDATDTYLVSEKSGVVYYQKGVEIGSKTYYALNDELKKELGLIK